MVDIEAMDIDIRSFLEKADCCQYFLQKSTRYLNHTVKICRIQKEYADLEHRGQYVYYEGTGYWITKHPIISVKK